MSSGDGMDAGAMKRPPPGPADPVELLEFSRLEPHEGGVRKVYRPKASSPSRRPRSA
jgi:hypothetical protein